MKAIKTFFLFIISFFKTKASDFNLSTNLDFKAIKRLALMNGTKGLSKQPVVMGVNKHGREYAWFHLGTDEGREYTVYGVGFKIDEALAQPILTDIVFQNYKDEMAKYNGKTIENCVIIGKAEHIRNIMYALGWSIPDERKNIFDKEEICD